MNIKNIFKLKNIFKRENILPQGDVMLVPTFSFHPIDEPLGHHNRISENILRQGDVMLVPTFSFHPIDEPLGHLTLAAGEATGHHHRISEGKAELHKTDGVLYLRVLSPTALLTHEEHAQISVPKGDWQILIQREYSPQQKRYRHEHAPHKWRDVVD
jgi:hypothetical protein